MGLEASRSLMAASALARDTPGISIVSPGLPVASTISWPGWSGEYVIVMAQFWVTDGVEATLNQPTLGLKPRWLVAHQDLGWDVGR